MNEINLSFAVRQPIAVAEKGSRPFDSPPRGQSTVRRVQPHPHQSKPYTPCSNQRRYGLNATKPSGAVSNSFAGFVSATRLARGLLDSHAHSNEGEAIFDRGLSEVNMAFG